MQVNDIVQTSNALLDIFQREFIGQQQSFDVARVQKVLKVAQVFKAGKLLNEGVFELNRADTKLRSTL